MVTKRLQAERDAVVLRSGSPNFFHTFGAIAATANEYVEMASTFPASRRYAPLMSLIITNRAGEFVDLEINGNNYAVIPAGVIFSVTDQAIWSFRLTNNDASAVAAGEITANISTPPLGADELARLSVGL